MKLDKRILPNIEKTKRFCFKNKTPELWEARRALELYYKENRLDPTKNWTRDPVHGEKVLKLIRRLNFELDKISSKYPLTDSRKMTKLKKKAETIAKGKVAKEKKEKAAEKEQAKKKGRAATKYDYPLIDGREMTAIEKKKYRQEQRNKAAGKAPATKAEKPAKKDKKAKAEKAKPTKKEGLKKVKKTKKTADKEED